MIPYESWEIQEWVQFNEQLEKRNENPEKSNGKN